METNAKKHFNIASDEAAVNLMNPPNKQSDQSFAEEQTRRNPSSCPKMTYRQRLFCFVVCYGLSLLLNLLSYNLLYSLITGHVERFAIPYAIATILSITSFFFLFSFKKQIKRMFDKTRWITTTVYLSAIFFTLYFSLYVGH